MPYPCPYELEVIQTKGLGLKKDQEKKYRLYYLSQMEQISVDEIVQALGKYCKVELDYVKSPHLCTITQTEYDILCRNL